MNLEDLEALEKEKQKVIEILQRENVKGFIFGCDIDDQDTDNKYKFTTKFFCRSTKEAIGYCELLKHYLIKKLTRD